VFVDNGGGDSKGSERGLEYDTVSAKYADFIEAEVLPAVKANDEIAAAYPNLEFIDNPEGRGTLGCSSGGAAAFTMGWFRPDKYRRLITYSGTFVDQQDDDAPTEEMYPFGAWDYHEWVIEESERLPLRVFLHVSDNDLNFGDDGHHNWMEANQNMATVLGAKGYHYRFVWANNANHCDYKVFQQTFPDTMEWMWRASP
jgi:iron(III)-enterobactin esterase